jgi:hypothetical protein
MLTRPYYPVYSSLPLQPGKALRFGAGHHHGAMGHLMADQPPNTWHIMAGQRVTDWQVVHEQPLHAFWISQDLQQFRHFHPPVDAQGRFTWVPPAQPGKALFTGVSQRQGPLEASMTTTGQINPTRLAVQPATLPQLGWQPSDRHPAVWGQLKRDGAHRVNLWLADSRGLPLPGVEALMAAPAHAVITDAKLAHLTHAHPVTPLVQGHDGSQKAMLPLVFHAAKPAGGQASVWFVQVCWQGQVHTLKLLDIPIG